jgi:hypothetical protein
MYNVCVCARMHDCVCNSATCSMVLRLTLATYICVGFFLQIMLSVCDLTVQLRETHLGTLLYYTLLSSTPGLLHHSLGHGPRHLPVNITALSLRATAAGKWSHVRMPRSGTVVNPIP